MSNAMTAPTSLCSTVASRSSFSYGNRVDHKTRLIGLRGNERRLRPMKASASYDRDNHYGKLVDEDMIVLRMRIRDIEMSTGTSDRKNEAPSHWMRWEKKYHAHYNSDVYEAVGLLQTQLMKTRPCLALGMLALVTLSVPVTTSALIFPLLDIVKGILLAKGIQL